MSCTVVLLRHGIAGPPPPGGSDADRGLTAEGKEKMEGVAAGLRVLGLKVDAVLASPLRRAQETAAFVIAGVSPKLEIDTFEPLTPGTPPEETVRALRPYRSARELVLVGHEPTLGYLASLLLTGSPGALQMEFKKGGAVAIEVAAIPPRGRGTLLWFLTPKQLRSIGLSDR